MGYVKKQVLQQYARDVARHRDLRRHQWKFSDGLGCTKLMDGGDVTYALLDEMQPPSKPRVINV